MTTIFEALRHDHEIQRSLIAKLVDTVGASDDRLETFAAAEGRALGPTPTTRSATSTFR